MIPYKQGDVILVPFPFTDLSLNKRRPAVVLSCESYNESGDLIIGFLSSNLNGSFKMGDFKLVDYKQAGLPLPTKFRAKFATISNGIIVKRIGFLTMKDQAAIFASIKAVLSLT
jgi:mRNA interferase MazF